VPIMSETPRAGGITFAGQDDLPKLPIPDLSHTCKKYLAALKPLQGPREHAETKHAVQEFLKHDGPGLQEKLQQYAVGKTSYIEQFCKSLPYFVIAHHILTSEQGTIRT
jgi:carnitine O-acetyltransferase